MRKIMKIISTLILLLVISGQTLAESDTSKTEVRRYDIEIIIFEDTHARYINNESWNHGSHTDTLPTSTKKVNTGAYKKLKPGILKHEYKRINASPEYNVLFYSAWRQTGLKASRAFEVDLDELKNTHTNSSENTISGKLKVVLARYLHFYSELNYRRNDSGIQNQITAGNDYPITMHRRMRSKELHYIDHPLVGILIQINPVK